MRLLNLLNRIAQFEAGRRFLMNYEYCYNVELFPEEFDQIKFWNELEECIDIDTSNRQILTAIHNLLDIYYYSSDLPWEELDCRSSYVYRLTTISRFLDEDFPLLSHEAVARYGYLRDDGADAAQLRLFAKDCTKNEFINQDAEIKGMHPFAWASNAPVFSGALKSIKGNEQEFGKKFCRLLALEGFDQGEALFLIRYPNDGENTLARRPTACDGVGSIYFKARTEKDAKHLCKTGYTIDLNIVENVDEHQTLPIPTYDGVPEFAVSPIKFSDQFGVYWAGFFDANWVDCDSYILDSVISGSANIEECLSRTFSMITNIAYKK